MEIKTDIGTRKYSIECYGKNIWFYSTSIAHTEFSVCFDAEEWQKFVAMVNAANSLLYTRQSRSLNGVASIDNNQSTQP